MENDNSEFGGFIDDHDLVNRRAYSEEQEMTLSVYGLLVDRLGYQRGKELFKAMERLARRASEQNGGKPGIAFDVEGGRFVAIVDPS